MSAGSIPRIHVQLGRSRADALGAGRADFVDLLGGILGRAYPMVPVTIEPESAEEHDRIEITSAYAEPDATLVRKLVDFAWTKYLGRVD
jgi:hypothetical protein